MSDTDSEGQPDAIDEDSTVENRAYLFRELASAFLVEHGGGLVGDGDARARTLRALGDLAYASCVLADRDDLEAAEVAARIVAGPENAPED